MDEHEVYFRDTAHGFLAWAFATVLGASVLATAAAAIVGTTVGVASTGRNGERFDTAPYVDRLLRPQLAAPQPAPAPGTPGSTADRTQTVRPVVLGGPALAETRAMLGRLLLRSLPEGGARQPDGLATEDRAYMGQIVTAYTGLDQSQAEQRISEVVGQMRVTADAARRAARNFALWLAAALLFGAFASSLAALEGGGLRDGRLRYGPRFALHRVRSQP